MGGCNTEGISSLILLYSCNISRKLFKETHSAYQIQFNISFYYSCYIPQSTFFFKQMGEICSNIDEG